MRWTGDRSGNLDDRRGMGGGGGLIGGGLGSLIIAAIVFFLGGDPSAVLQSSGQGMGAPTSQRELSQEDLKVREFVSMLTAENEQSWNEIFKEKGLQYRPVKVVLFEQATQSGCGTAQSAMGPFYCPTDETIYMDMSFFNELRNRFGADVGEFSVAYVMAHEMGHHVQNLLGILDKVHSRRQSGQLSESQINAESVATELQADFLAGVWAKKTESREKFLEPGDLEQAISAAEAVGDDNIQRQTSGYVNQESFTHGSSAQRKEWFMRGYTTGDINAGDTFSELIGNQRRGRF